MAQVGRMAPAGVGRTAAVRSQAAAVRNRPVEAVPRMPVEVVAFRIRVAGTTLAQGEVSTRRLAAVSQVLASSGRLSLLRLLRLPWCAPLMLGYLSTLFGELAQSVSRWQAHAANRPTRGSLDYSCARRSLVHATPFARTPPRRQRTMTARILVVDDDTALAEMIGIVLRTEGFEPHFCADGALAIDAFHAAKPDLVLLDLMLPGLDGIEVCGRIRAESGTPVIMLTAKSDTADVVKGLESGADDYMVKPFNPKELVARIRTRLRPAPTEPATERMQIGDLEVDVAAHEVRRGDARINLTPLEFDLLLALASKPQQVFTREMLLEQVWGYHYKADTRLVNVHVQRLRAKVEDDPDNPKIVMTVRGVGYRAGAVT